MQLQALPQMTLLPVEQSDCNSGCGIFRSIINLTGTAVAITGLVMAVLAQAWIVAALFGTAALFSLFTELTCTSNSCSANSPELEAATTKVIELQNQVSVLETEIQTLKEQQEELIRAREDTSRQSSKEVVALNEQIMDLKYELTVTKTELATAQAVNTVFEQSLDELRAQHQTAINASAKDLKGALAALADERAIVASLRAAATPAAPAPVAETTEQKKARLTRELEELEPQVAVDPSEGSVTARAAAFAAVATGKAFIPHQGQTAGVVPKNRDSFSGALGSGPSASGSSPAPADTETGKKSPPSTPTNGKRKSKGRGL